ncbi:MAG TPA: hypothetical protein VGT99_08665 [Gammaproteobacteria bacterium]|nr:hypothetical protein [Gammaproteobacteria bacterium]
MASTVFIPDFRRGFEAAGGPRLPALERMVARAVARKAPTEEEFLAPLFGLKPQQLAPAPVMHLADSGAADGRYRLCADFVHLAPDRDQLVLLPESLLQAVPEEIAALAAAFNGLYGAEGWKLELTPRGRSYLQCPLPLDVATSRPDAAAGQAVLEYMPQGADAVRLKQLMNESQMLFHAHAVNRAREDAGRPLINSLWLWGGGVLPKGGAAHAPRRILGELSLLRGLALWAGRAPEDAALAVMGDDVLLGLPATDPGALERDWLQPLFTRLKSGSFRHLALYLGGFGLFELDTRAARRFWRRAGPLTMVHP